MHKRESVHRTAHLEALGAMVDAEAALGDNPHPAIRSVVTANAAMSALLRHLLAAPGFWEKDKLEELLAEIERDSPNPPVNLPATGQTRRPPLLRCNCWSGGVRCSRPAPHNGEHHFMVEKAA